MKTSIILLTIMVLANFNFSCTKKSCNLQPILKYCCHERFPNTNEFCHYVFFENYNPDCFTKEKLISTAYQYLDTISVDTPVTSLDFQVSRKGLCNPDNPYDYYEVDVRKYNVFSISFNIFIKRGNDSLPYISMITYYENGKPVRNFNVKVADYENKILDSLYTNKMVYHTLKNIP